MMPRLLPVVLAGLLLTAATVLCASEAAPGSAPAGVGVEGPPAVKLSLADAVRLAHEHSPVARAAAARVAGASARLHGARALESPMLTLAHNVGGGTLGGDEAVLLTHTIAVGKKRAAPIAAAQAERSAAAAGSQQTSVEITREAQDAYYQALRADAERQSAAEALHTAQVFGQAAEVQFEAGDVAQNQVVRSKIEVAKAQQEFDAAEAERADRYSALRSRTGLPEDVSLSLTDALEVTPRSYALPDLLGLAMRDRPDLRAARLQEEARAAQVQEARAQSHPDLVWEVRNDRVSFGGGEQSLRVGVSLPLLDRGRKRAQVQSAEAAVSEQRAVTDESVRTARLEIESALRALDLARRQLESFQTGRVARAKELLSMAQLGYEHGASSYLELLDAEQAYRTEQVGFVRAQAAYHIALAALQQAVGGRLP